MLGKQDFLPVTLFP